MAPGAEPGTRGLDAWRLVPLRNLCSGAAAAPRGPRRVRAHRPPLHGGGAGASGQGDVCATCPLPHTAERPHPVTFLDGSSWVSQHKGEGGGLCPGRRGCRGSPAWAPGAFPPRGTQSFCTQSPWRSVAWAQLAGRGQVEGEGKSAAKPGQRRRGLEGGQGTRDGEAQRPRARGGRRAPPGGHREERTRGAFAASARNTISL